MANAARPVVEWITPLDAAWLQDPETPSSLVQRVCEGFRIALWRPAPNAQPEAWLAATLQRGGVAFFDPPAAKGELLASQASALLDFARQGFSRNARVTQLLLPIESKAEAQGALDAGFQHAADLLLLGRQFRLEELLPPSPDLEFRPAGEELAQVLNDTYVGTLDCPVLSGKRPLADVLDGYAATGASGRSLWRTVFAADEPVGCILVAAHTKMELAELVYMGLVPSARGRKWGDFLLQEAERLALGAGLDRMVIGVDAANHPARKVYEGSGYARWDQKRVYLAFPEPSGGAAP